MKLRIALIAMLCEKGAIQENTDKIISSLEKASAKNIDIAIFPEMSLTGYADPTKDSKSILEQDSLKIKNYLDLTQNSPITSLVGYIEKNPNGKPFIAQVVSNRGKIEGKYRKVTIVDEEELWFAPGEEVPTFSYHNLKFGVVICADLSNEKLFADLKNKGVSIVFHPSAPGLYGEQATRNWQAGYEWWSDECNTYLGQFAKKYGLWIASVSQAGRTVDEDFPGGVFVFNPEGKNVFTTSDWNPRVVYLEIDLDTGKLSIL